jgi:hypothetical protein
MPCDRRVYRPLTPGGECLSCTAGDTASVTRPGEQPLVTEARGTTPGRTKGERQMQKSKFRGAVVGTSVGLIAFGSVASAAFLASGELNAPVKAGTVQTMNVTAVVKDQLYPGYLSDVTLTFSNPNSVETRITSVDFKNFVGDSQLTPYLLAEQKLLINGVNPQGVSRPMAVAPGQSVTVTLPDAIGLKANTPNAFAQKAIQGATATAVYTVGYAASPGTESAKLEGAAATTAP